MVVFKSARESIEPIKETKEIMKLIQGEEVK